MGSSDGVCGEHRGGRGAERRRVQGSFTPSGQRKSKCGCFPVLTSRRTTWELCATEPGLNSLSSPHLLYVNKQLLLPQCHRLIDVPCPIVSGCRRQFITAATASFPLQAAKHSESPSFKLTPKFRIFQPAFSIHRVPRGRQIQEQLIIPWLS